MGFSSPTMSNIDVDDLVATLNAHHIGSEQLDLANLHAQLEQVLQVHARVAPFPASPVQIAYPHPGGVPTNTPTARTPSWSHFADAAQAQKRRNNSVASTRDSIIIPEEDEVHWCRDDSTYQEMEQDLMKDIEGETDVSLCSVSGQFHSSQSPTFGNAPNTYAAMDPFLAAQLQAVEPGTLQSSLFATAQQHASPFCITAHQVQPVSMFPVQTSQMPHSASDTQAQAWPQKLNVDTAAERDAPRFP